MLVGVGVVLVRERAEREESYRVNLLTSRSRLLRALARSFAQGEYMDTRIVSFELEDGRPIEVEIRDGARKLGGTSEVGLDDDIKRKLGDSLEKLGAVAAAVVGKLRNANPGEIEVAFGVKLGGQTNLILTAGSAEANLSVKLKWTRGGDKT